MLQHGRASLGSEASDDVDHALGHASVNQRSNQVESRERGVLRGFNHACVAANQRGKKLPRRDGHGEVPRGNHGADTQGVPDRHRKLVWQFRGSGRPKHSPSLAGHVVRRVHSFLNVTAGFFQDFAHFPGHVARVVFFALCQYLGSGIDDLSPAGCGHQSPLQECLLRGVDGLVNIRFCGPLENPDYIAGVGWVAVLESFPRRGFDPFAIDKVVVNVGSVGCSCEDWAGESVGYLAPPANFPC